MFGARRNTGRIWAQSPIIKADMWDLTAQGARRVITKTADGQAVLWTSRQKTSTTLLMMSYSRLGTTVAVLLGLVVGGCASSPVAPFNQLEKSNLLVFRLQNYEPPAAQPAAANQAAPILQNLPPEIQSWIQQGAQALPQLIPPGLLGNLNPTTAPPAQEVPRFYGYRILGQTQVADPDLKKQLAELFGSKDNFEAPKMTCVYPELGFSFGPGPGQPSNDLVVSFSCNQVQARSFPWPHAYTGMTSNTVSELTQIVKKLWPGG